MNKLSRAWKKEWTEIIIIVATLRLIYACIGIWVVSSGGPIPLNETIYELVKPCLKSDFFSKLLINPWFGWDTISYLRIAMMGYGNDATTTFMPLYPLLVRILAYLFGRNYLLSALVLSTLCTTVVLILLRELLIQQYPEEIARGAVISFVTFPTAFFLLAGYTESLFLTCVLAFWILARKRQWLWAGLCAGLATLTRLQGVILSVVMLWMMLSSLVEHPTPSLLMQVGQMMKILESLPQRLFHSLHKTIPLAIPIPLLVASGYQAWLKLSGYGTSTDALQKYWHLQTVPPWTGFILFLQRLSSTHFNYMDWIDLALFVIALLAALIGLRLLDPAFSLYVWLTIAVLLTRGTPPHLLASYSRYFLALFPLSVLPALLPNKFLRLLILSVSYSVQILLVTIFLWGSWVA